MNDDVIAETQRQIMRSREIQQQSLEYRRESEAVIFRAERLFTWLEQIDRGRIKAISNGEMLPRVSHK